ncbi:MAG: hypothetical protein RLZZ480_96 [Candidatus Parcubacteria bacterium]|jgi:hypothetical protein
MRISEKNVKASKYHKVLRVSVVVCTLMLLFETGAVHKSTKQLSISTHDYLANVVGATASVEPTELNTLTAELTAQKLALQQRESAVSEREIEVGLAPGESANQKTTYILAGILFVLLVLMVINYTLDFLRYRELKRIGGAKTV